MSDLTALSLGAGVQSTTLLLAVDGHLPKPDVAIFADTGWEPAAVYAQVDRAAAEATSAGIGFHRVSKGNLRRDAVDPDHRYASIPYFVRNPDGSEGMGRRQCTSEYKLAPITRKIRELLGAAAPDFRRVPKGRVAEQWVGFSTDEVQRANRRRDSQGVKYLTTRYPLLDLGMSRTDCQKYLTERGWGDTQKSACIGCPYHGNRQWRELRDTNRRRPRGAAMTTGGAVSGGRPRNSVGKRVDTRIHNEDDGLMTTTTHHMTSTYGGNDCCDERKAFHVTLTNATGTVTYETCTEHRDECAATASRSVGGWGTVTLTVEELAVREDVDFYDNVPDTVWESDALSMGTGQ